MDQREEQGYEGYGTPGDIDLGAEFAVGAEVPPVPGSNPDDDYQWYRPGLFARLTQNRALLILLIVAFLVLVIGPSLFYILNPPRPRPPLPVRGRGIPALVAPIDRPASS